MKKLLSILVSLFMVLVLLTFLVPSVVLAVPYDASLVLENKDAGWQVIPDGVSGTLDYKSSGPTFDYQLVATGLTPSTSYSLIYYADPYSGNNPGAFLGTFSSNETGNLTSGPQSVNIGHNLPLAPDTNMTTSHCTPHPDNYTHCYGAKIWLVRTSDYNSVTKSITAFNPTNYLFETDLITYQYTTSGGVDLDATVLPAVIGISISPPSLNFGSIPQGGTSGVLDITVNNTGSVNIGVASLVSGQFYLDCLQISTDGGTTWIDAEVLNYSPISVGGSKVFKVRLVVPAGYVLGSYSGSIAFIASGV